MPFNRFGQQEKDVLDGAGFEGTKDLDNWNRAVDVLAKVKVVPAGGKLLDQHESYKKAMTAAQLIRKELDELVKRTPKPQSLKLMTMPKVIDKFVADLKREANKRYL